MRRLLVSLLLLTGFYAMAQTPPPAPAAPAQQQQRGAGGRRMNTREFLGLGREPDKESAARGAKLYDSLEAGRGLLGLFEMEKALYELRYEIGNRPTWVGIPLQGILDVDAGQ